MARKEVGGLAPSLVLTDGYVVRIAALSPTDGSAVTGVTISNVAMQVDTVDPVEEVEPATPFTPLFVYGVPS